jgi:hypothetical protein
LLADLTALLPLFPILLGISGQFGIFLDTRKEFRDRINLRREALKENLAMYLADLLGYVRSVQDEPLRGDGGSPDLVKRYTTETWRTFESLTKIARLQFWFRFGHFFLFVTTLAGFVLFLAALLKLGEWSVLRDSTIGVIGMQLIAIVMVYVASNWLDKHE